MQVHCTLSESGVVHLVHLVHRVHLVHFCMHRVPCMHRLHLACTLHAPRAVAVGRGEVAGVVTVQLISHICRVHITLSVCVGVM